MGIVLGYDICYEQKQSNRRGSEGRSGEYLTTTDLKEDVRDQREGVCQENK